MGGGKGVLMQLPEVLLCGFEDMKVFAWGVGGELKYFFNTAIFIPLFHSSPPSQRPQLGVRVEEGLLSCLPPVTQISGPASPGIRAAPMC